MPFHFAFTTAEVLWTVTFAAQLVLLVVLLGRDRVQRFKWFTIAILLVGLRLLIARVLYNRMATLPYEAMLITLADLSMLASLMVLVELARLAFSGASRRSWVIFTVAMTLIGAAALAVWGPWPSWQTLTAQSQLAALMMMQLAAQKGGLLANVLTIELGLVMAFYGRRFGAGWRSHTQQIMIGLSTVAIGQSAVQTILQYVGRTPPRSMAEFEHTRALQDKLINGDNAIYAAMLVWWIVCLWIDEPGAAAPAVEAAEIESAPGEPLEAAPEGADLDLSSEGPDAIVEKPTD